jgi:putative heme transporter
MADRATRVTDRGSCLRGSRRPLADAASLALGSGAPKTPVRPLVGVPCHAVTAPPEPQAGQRGPFRRRLDDLATPSWQLLVVLLLASAVIVGLNRLKVVVIPVLVALFLASIGSPAVTRLKRRGLPPLLATWIVLLVGLVTIGFGVWFIISALAGAVDDIDEVVIEGWGRFQEWLAAGPLGLGTDRVEQLIQDLLDQLGGSTGELIDQLLAGAGTVTEVVTGFLLTLIVAFFVMKDGETFWHWSLTRFRADRRPVIDEAGRSAWSTLRRYLAGTAVIGVANALAIGIALAIVGNPLVLPLALLVFAGSFFPFVGAVFSGVVASLATLATVGFGPALVIAAVTILVQQLEGDLLQPLVMGHAVELHPLAVILSLTIGAIVGGLVGAFLAVPTVAVVAQVIRTVRPAWLQTHPVSP